MERVVQGDVIQISSFFVKSVVQDPGVVVIIIKASRNYTTNDNPRQAQ